MRIKTHHTTLSTLLKRVALCGLAALTLSACGLRPAAALPPEPIEPIPPPPIVYKPDLVISTFYNFSDYQAIVTIKNQGNASSKSCTFRLDEYYLDTFWWDVFLVASKDYYVPALGKGGSHTFSVHTTYNTFNPYFYFYGTVDIYNVVSEKSESNNVKWFVGE